MNKSIGLQRGVVHLEPYIEKWVQDFEIEAEILKNIFADVALRIEHIGSTSIPGLSAKPIIDILIGIKKLSDISHVKQSLKGSGYFYRENACTADRIFFAKGPEEHRTHYVHIVEYKGDEWNKLIKFRDYLRKNDKARDDYMELKTELAEQYRNERSKYTKAKNDFIQSIIKN